MQHSLTRESGIGARRMFVSDDPQRVKAVTLPRRQLPQPSFQWHHGAPEAQRRHDRVRAGDRGAQEAAQHEPPGSDGRGQSPSRYRSCPTPWLSTGGSPEAAPSSAGTHAPAAALAGLSEVDGWR